ncbi:MAG: hypothetical protein HYW77_02895 [Parcubacteria group bacterium]|nr:hypothetical protein [Parcubacteria group bacterium]
MSIYRNIKMWKFFWFFAEIILFLFLLFIPLKAQQHEIRIERNAVWNDIVSVVEKLSDHLKPVQDFLKANEKFPRLEIVDLPTTENLDKAIKDSEELTKKLKELKDEIWR